MQTNSQKVPTVRSLTAFLGAVLTSLAVLAGVIPGGYEVSASADVGRPEIVVNGRGWGHGRGMGQYGALGYATNFGWSSGQILNHFYGGTTAGQAPSPGVVNPARVRVDLVAMQGRPTTVSIGDGSLQLRSASGASIREVTGAVRLTPSAGSMTVEVAPDCTGPWTDAPSIDQSLVRVQPDSSSTSQSGLLQVCGPSYQTWYAGEIWATSTGGSSRTINLVTIEEYLRGVVPNEMPASWDSAALEAQAVAARSYALAGDFRWEGYADTCDTTTCQVYDGRFTTRGSAFRESTHPRTDDAIAATTGLVRLTASGAVARTEFSSSTGGHTVGGDFTAVVDEGDAVEDNPNHLWQTTINLQSVEDSAGLGALLGLEVSERNGLGTEGGRAVEVIYRFENGSTSVDGNSFRRQFGLRSDWFWFGSFSRGGVVQSPTDSSAVDEFVEQAFERLQGRQPTENEVASWRGAVQFGSRLELTEELVASDFFAGQLIDDLYRRALGRASDAQGRTYWVTTMTEGFTYEQIGTLFYGSPEYVRRTGNTNERFVQSLYVNILGRQPDPGGNAYWVALLDDGLATPADVANGFYRSVESRRDRARSLYQLVLEQPPAHSDVEVYAERLRTVGDLRLAAELAASPNFTEEST